MANEKTDQDLRGVAQLGARVVWDHEVAGSIPVTPTIKTNVLILNFDMRGYRISVILQPSKLERWVRFPLPAPLKNLMIKIK